MLHVAPPVDKSGMSTSCVMLRSGTITIDNLVFLSAVALMSSYSIDLWKHIVLKKLNGFSFFVGSGAPCGQKRYKHQNHLNDRMMEYIFDTVLHSCFPDAW